MARQMKKAVNDNVETIQEPTETTVKESVMTKNIMQAPQKKKYADEDLIPCRSVTAGQLVMHGAKSDETYSWQGMNDVQYIEYRDLIYAYRRRSPLIFKPRFVILDEEFTSQYSDIQECYRALYSFKDIKELLKLAPSALRKAVEALPVGIQDSIKTTVVTLIDNGQFDSAQRIRVLDDIFGTDMLIKLTQ